MKESLDKEDKGDSEIFSLSYTFELINKINKDFKDFYRKIINEYQLTIPQFCVLKHLGKLGGLQLGELASCCHLSRSTMTGVIDTMEKSKIVVRAKNPEDRRSLLVVMTDKGKQIYNKLPKEEILTTDYCDAINSEEIRVINELLIKVSKIFSLKK